MERLGAATLLAPADPARHALLAGVYMLATWTWVSGLTGAALRFLSGHHPAIRYVADSSYWIYIAHLPVVMAFQVLVYPLARPPSSSTRSS